MEDYINLFINNINNLSHNDVELFVTNFISNNSINVRSLCKKAFGDNSELSLSAFKEIISPELKKASILFANNEYNSKNIKPYLIACMVNIAKNISNENKSNAFICPACKFFDKISSLESKGRNLFCKECSIKKDSVTEEWEKLFYKTFAIHSKGGVRCGSCNRFIPTSYTKNKKTISCPYNDCIFVGDVQDLKSMRHPMAKINLESLILDKENSYEDGKSSTIKDSIDNSFSINNSSNYDLNVKEDIEDKISIINDVIDSQMNVLHYKSNEFTLKNKLLMYKAFKIMLDKEPKEMVSYLVYLNKEGLQHKIFKEFVNLLEKEIPFAFQKRGKKHEVTSLLDPNLCIFDGISEFESTVNDKFEINNETKELYVGGRKGSYCKPFYIGKLVEVLDINGNSILDKVIDYNFHKIILSEDIAPKTQVKVKHLRIAPHYQMGGLVYLNRIRRNIVDKVYFIINGKKRPTR